MHEKSNFKQALACVTEHWSPKVVGQINNQYVKVAKLLGEFTWHKHDNEDEMFYIVKGDLRIEYEDGSVDLSEGDFHIVPRNTLHNPVAEKECWVALIEPVETKHTGDVDSPLTKSIAEQLT
jgi:mannose-6-phosphate isomerase-like protein (cupin superfamily)